MEFQTLVEALSEFGLAGVIAALVILLGVFAAKRAGIVATGNHARLANIVLSAILYGLADNPEAETALLAVISSVLAGLFYQGLEYAGNKSRGY